jgi:protein SCO1/2
MSSRSLSPGPLHRSLLALLVPLIFSLSCSHKPAGKTYELQGRVVAVDASAHELTVAHQDIPGLMKGMTMPFQVSPRDQWVFKNIAPGDQIHATLVLSDHAELDEISFTKAPLDATDGTSKMHIAEPGELVPDFVLVNQSGKKIHLSQFRGKPLLLTFIYTQCPFPDYCVRMSSNFSQVLKRLQKDPRAFEWTQLLSISIDPEHDKPATLRSYGERYAGATDPNFVHWEFASGSAEQVRQAADFFGLAYNRKEGQIVHGLRTVLIGADGKILKIYSGNDWKPEDVAAEFAVAAQAAPPS